MRGKKVYNATNGEAWMGQGLISKCKAITKKADKLTNIVDAAAD